MCNECNIGSERGEEMTDQRREIIEAKPNYGNLSYYMKIKIY